MTVTLDDNEGRGRWDRGTQARAYLRFLKIGQMNLCKLDWLD